MKSCFIFLTVLLLAIIPLSGKTLQLTGILESGDGAKLHGLYTLTFKIKNESNQYIDWQQTQSFIINDGLFSTNLGDVKFGAIKELPDNINSSYTIEVISNNDIISTIKLNSGLNKVYNNNDKLLGAKTLLSDIDQGNAQNDQVLSWNTSQNSWRPRTIATGSGSQTGVISLNGKAGNRSITVGDGLRIDNNDPTNIKIWIDTVLSPPTLDFELPIGTVIPFAGDTASLRQQGLSDKWKLCDGSIYGKDQFPDAYKVLALIYGIPNNDPNKFYVPDYRGLFLRGVSYSTNNDPDKGSRSQMFDGGNQQNKVGTIQQDAFQGHKHNLVNSGNFGEKASYGIRGGAASTHWYLLNPSVLSDTQGSLEVGNPIEDQKNNGTIRTSSESRPKNAYVNYIIKLK